MKYKKTNAVSKIGINYIKRIIKRSGGHFQIIHQENDIGLDCIVEIINLDKSKRLAIQVKSGNSYFTPNNQSCKIPIENHREYWLSHDFPVLGIVYIPDLWTSYMVDIKKYLLENPNKNYIVYKASEENEFSWNRFDKELRNEYTQKQKPITIFREYTSKIENKSLNILINHLGLTLSEVIPKIIETDTFFEFLGLCNVKIIDAISLNTLENVKQFRTCSSKWHGVFRFSHDKEVFFSNQSTIYFEKRFSELKLKLNEGLF